MAAGSVMQQSERLRVGIVGGGRIADLNLSGLDRPPSRRNFAAVCDIDAGTRERRSAEWSCTAYEKLDDLLADPTVDAIEILTPHQLHAEQAIAALEAGKHVSLQKPPTLTLAEYDRVAAAARNAGTVLRVYENFNILPAAPSWPARSSTRARSATCCRCGS